MNQKTAILAMTLLCLFPSVYAFASDSPAAPAPGQGLFWMAALLAIVMLAIVLYIWVKTGDIKKVNDQSFRSDPADLQNAVKKLGLREIESLLASKRQKRPKSSDKISSLIAGTAVLLAAE